jgi:hypothetical protein
MDAEEKKYQEQFGVVKPPTPGEKIVPARKELRKPEPFAHLGKPPLQKQKKALNTTETTQPLFNFKFGRHNRA